MRVVYTGRFNLLKQLVEVLAALLVALFLVGEQIFELNHSMGAYPMVRARALIQQINEELA